MLDHFSMILDWFNLILIGIFKSEEYLDVFERRRETTETCWVFSWLQVQTREGTLSGQKAQSHGSTNTSKYTGTVEQQQTAICAT